ncbi:hypothetical protein EDB87DRAFT_866932 [Lactarius vividus]|nr:hypothetical protein EDB87DRAFT_866932 [Lactarius vividus]
MNAETLNASQVQHYNSALNRAQSATAPVSGTTRAREPEKGVYPKVQRSTFNVQPKNALESIRLDIELRQSHVLLNQQHPRFPRSSGSLQSTPPARNMDAGSIFTISIYPRVSLIKIGSSANVMPKDATHWWHLRATSIPPASPAPLARSVVANAKPALQCGNGRCDAAGTMTRVLFTARSKGHPKSKARPAMVLNCSEEHKHALSASGSPLFIFLMKAPPWRALGYIHVPQSSSRTSLRVLSCTYIVILVSAPRILHRFSAAHTGPVVVLAMRYGCGYCESQSGEENRSPYYLYQKCRLIPRAKVTTCLQSLNLCWAEKSAHGVAKTCNALAPRGWKIEALTSCRAAISIHIPNPSYMPIPVEGAVWCQRDSVCRGGFGCEDIKTQKTRLCNEAYRRHQGANRRGQETSHSEHYNMYNRCRELHRIPDSSIKPRKTH